MEGLFDIASLLEHKSVELQSNWNVENNRKLEDTLTLSASAKTSSQCKLEDMVNYESCVHLLGTKETLCELKIKSASCTNLLTQICIVSEARIIELYGTHGEYLTTNRAEFLDDFEEMSVYSAVIKLPEPSVECMLKLIPMKRSERSIWMYGVNVAVERAMLSKKMESSVNFENVNKIIKDSGQQLTEKAERCKAFLQQYSTMSVLDSNKFCGKPPDPQILMKMLQSAYLPPGQGFGEQAKNVSKHLSGLLPEFALSKSKSDNQVVLDDLRQDVSTEIPSDKLELELLKSYVDKRLVSLETKLVQIIDDKLRDSEIRQNTKLEMILMRLDSIEKSLTLKS